MKKKRRAVIRMSYDELHKILRLKDDVLIRAVTSEDRDWAHERISIYLAGENEMLEEVPENYESPQIKLSSVQKESEVTW